MLKVCYAFLMVCLALVAPVVRAAQISVDILVTPLSGGSFRYEVTIGNAGPDDVVLVTLVDAPLGDPLIDPTLIWPPGFLASYDPGLGLVDFLEDTDLFAAGTSVSGFQFDSLAGPDFFRAFEALTVFGDPDSGSTNITLVPVPEPSTLLLAACSLMLIVWRRWGATAG